MAVIISSGTYSVDITKIISKSDTGTISEKSSFKIDFWESFGDHKDKIAKVLKNKPISADLTQIQLAPEFVEQFFVLNDDFHYQSISAELIVENDHSYFYVQESLISVYGREQVEAAINEEKQRFEEKIYNESIETFGNIEGSLGNIGNGKIIVLIANLPTNVAGYFDPVNEYSQEFLDSNGMGEYKSNEWEMIFLDYNEKYETTLAHEFQHLIHYNHDANEARWFDEGCSELAGYVTNCQPESWENVTIFAKTHFKYHSDDSLVYWNYYSSEGRNVRIDYGGSYLFLHYLYEQMGKEEVKEMIDDSLPAIRSISSELQKLNRSFNDLYMDWITALILDNQTIDSRYGFENMDYQINPLKTINGEYSGNIYAPYYGAYTVSLRYTDKKYETTIINKENKRIGVVAIYKEEGEVVRIEQYTTTDSALFFLPVSNYSEVILSFSYLDTEQPAITGAFGTGDIAKIEIRNIDPFYLSITNPAILKNSTHLSIYGLNVLFLNGTDIHYGSDNDSVTVEIGKDYSSLINQELEFNPVKYLGWGSSIDISSLLPGNYYVDLIVSTGEYYFKKRIYTFKITFEILFSSVKITINNDTSTLSAECIIIILPKNFQEYVIDVGEIFAYIYDSSHKYILKVKLENLEENLWNITTNVDNFEEGYYYIFTRLIFQNEVFSSFRSNIVYFKPINVSRSVFRVDVIIAGCVLVVYLNSRKKNRIKNRGVG